MVAPTMKILLITICIVPSFAILFDKKREAQRREIPAPVYGSPSQAKYPPPPPDIPPPATGASSGYSVPILQYGPPKINFNGGVNKLSALFENFKKQNYKSFPKHQQPSQAYGAPQPRPQYGPPKKLGNFPIIPQKLIGIKPQHNHSPRPHYGPPASQKSHFGCDGWTPILGPVGHVGHSAPSSFGVDLNAPSAQPAPVYGPPTPSPVYGGPAPVSLHVLDVHSPTALQLQSPSSSYGPPATGPINVEVIPLQQHVQDPSLQVPELGSNGLFQHELSGGFDIIKSQGFELSQNSVADSYGPPPAVQAPTSSYGPPKQFFVPQSHHNHYPQKTNLGIHYGSITGNLKPWPIQGSPPKQPLSFREPVPQGLLESIGHHVEQLDTFGGGQTHEPQNIYLPPPPKQVPITDYHTIQFEQQTGQTQHNDISNFNGGHHFDANSVSITHQHSCNQGPNLSGDGYHALPFVQQSFGYDVAASTQDIIQAHNKKLETKESSYGPPATGIPSHHLSSAASNVVPQEVLPGLDGLNVISAQRSHSIEVPASGAGSSSYEIQFQKSIGSESGNGAAIIGDKHNHLINDGLLQSIISAVEQTPATANSDQQLDPSEDSEVKIIFNNKSTADQQPAEKPKEEH